MGQAYNDLMNILDKYDLPKCNADYLFDLWEMRKAGLAERFGFCEENSYRIEIGKSKDIDSVVMLNKAYFNTTRMITLFLRVNNYRDVSPRDIIRNRLSQYGNVKVSRVIGKLNKEDQFFEFARNWGDEILLTDGLGDITAILKELCLNTERKSLDEAIKAIIPTYYEKVSLKTSRIEISINPFDIVGSNHNSSYTSCLRGGGEYFNTVLSYLVDSFTIIVSRYDQKGKRVGRAWLYVFPEKGFMLLANSYGTFNTVDRNAVLKFVQDKLNKTGRWNQGEGEEVEQYSCCGIYIDDFAHGDFVYDGSVLSPSSTPEIFFENPFCLACGEQVDSDYGEKGICHHCDNTVTCEHCGGRVDVDEAFHYSEDGTDHCPTCRDEFFAFCEDCDEYYPANDVRYVDSVGHSVCGYCLDYEYFQCRDCGEYFQNSEGRNSVGTHLRGEIEVCDDCFEAYTQCDYCSNFVTDCLNETSNGNDVCDHCLDKHYTQCNGCGEYFEENSLINGFCSESCVEEVLLTA